MDTERQLKNLQSLLDVSKAMSSQIPLHTLLHVIAEKTKEILQADRCTIFLYEDSTNELWSVVAQGLDQFKEIRIPLNEGIAGEVARSGKVINLSDAYADARFNQEIDRQTGYRTRSILCLPMISGNGPLTGVLEVLNKYGDIPFNQEDEDFLMALATHAAIALERSRLIEAYIEKQTLDATLKQAHEIQMSLLPHTFPPFPQISNIDIFATIQPAWEVGGDLYDFVLTANGSIAFAIADVAGKGMPAALFMAITRTLIKASIRKGLEPHEILQEVNMELCSNNDSCTFVTLFCGLLNPHTGEVLYSNAGHIPPIVIQANGNGFLLNQETGIAAGVLEDADYRLQRMNLNKGDSLFLYTDGVTEALDQHSRMFSENRLKEEVKKLHECTSEEIISGLLTSLRKYSQGVSQSDDIAMLNLKMTRGGESGPLFTGTVNRF